MNYNNKAMELEWSFSRGFDPEFFVFGIIIGGTRVESELGLKVSRREVLEYKFGHNIIKLVNDY